MPWPQNIGNDQTVCQIRLVSHDKLGKRHRNLRISTLKALFTDCKFRQDGKLYYLCTVKMTKDSAFNSLKSPILTVARGTENSSYKWAAHPCVLRAFGDAHELAGVAVHFLQLKMKPSIRLPRLKLVIRQ